MGHQLRCSLPKEQQHPSRTHRAKEKCPLSAKTGSFKPLVVHTFINSPRTSSFQANPTSPVSSQHFQHSLIYFPLLFTGSHVVSQLFWSSLPVVTFSSSAFPRCSRPHPLQRAPQETGTSQTVPQFFPQSQKQKLLLLNLLKK